MSQEGVNRTGVFKVLYVIQEEGKNTDKPKTFIH